LKEKINGTTWIFMTMKNSDFDIDLKFGKEGENTVANILSIETVEVKRDKRWKDTGNLYIETDCWYNGSQSWEKSGLSVSKATHYAFVLENMVVVVTTPDLKAIVEKKGRAIECKIEPNPSKGYLIKLSDIVEHQLA
jgi:hypothetical protein